ncbi:MAG: hypothetical protein WCI23_05080 [Chlorobiaceae bacterium]
MNVERMIGTDCQIEITVMMSTLPLANEPNNSARRMALCRSSTCLICLSILSVTMLLWFSSAINYCPLGPAMY